MGDIIFMSADWSNFHSTGAEGQSNLDGLSIGNYEQQISEAARSFDVILSNKTKSVTDVQVYDFSKVVSVLIINHTRLKYPKKWPVLTNHQLD